MTIYVGNVSESVEASHLQQLFEAHGVVKNVSLPVIAGTGKARGFAFVDMEDESDEDEAIAALNGTKLLDKSLKLTKAESNDNPGSSSGSATSSTNVRERGVSGASYSSYQRYEGHNRKR